MGHSIALSGRLSFPASRAAALRSLVVDCDQFDDWPSASELFEAGASNPRSMEAIVAAFETGDLAEVEWADDSLRVAGIVAADDASWIYGGRELLALFRAAGSTGASGGLGMTGWVDGGPMEVVSITTKADGSNSLSIMRGKQAENAAQAIHEHVEHLAEAITKPALPAAGPAVLPLVGPELEHHRVVVAVLKKHDPMQMFELARALDLPDDTERFAFGASPFHQEPLTSKLRDASALMAGFENGWAGLTEPNARRVAKRALELCARLDREGARSLAQRAIEANLQGPVRAQAELLAVKSTDATAGLAALRRVLASNPPSSSYELLDHPMIEKISKQPAARTVVLRELASLVGGAFDGSKQWKPYNTEQANYAAALSFVLEAVLEPNDDMLDALLELWTTHPSGKLAFHDLALEHGAAARKIFNEHFASTELALERALPFHTKAADIAIQHDPASALVAFRTLLAAKPLHVRTEDIANGLVVALDEGELPKEGAWRDVLLQISRAYAPQSFAAEAAKLASRLRGAGGKTSERPTKVATKPEPVARAAAPAKTETPPKASAKKEPLAPKEAATKKPASPKKTVAKNKPAPNKKPTLKKSAAASKARPKKPAAKKPAAKKPAAKKPAAKKPAAKKPAAKKPAAKKRR